MKNNINLPAPARATKFSQRYSLHVLRPELQHKDDTQLIDCVNMLVALRDQI